MYKLIIVLTLLGVTGAGRWLPDLAPQNQASCYGLVRGGRPDLQTARALTQVARQMAALADSSRKLLMAQVTIGGFEDPTREFYISAADVAGRAEAFAPDDPAVLLTAATLHLRAATLGEARLDTVMGLRAECFATRAMAVVPDPVTGDSAKALLRDIQLSLAEERRAAKYEPR